MCSSTLKRLSLRRKRTGKRRRRKIRNLASEAAHEDRQAPTTQLARRVSGEKVGNLLLPMHRQQSASFEQWSWPQWSLRDPPSSSLARWEAWPCRSFPRRTHYAPILTTQKTLTVLLDSKFVLMINQMFLVMLLSLLPIGGLFNPEVKGNGRLSHQIGRSTLKLFELPLKMLPLQPHTSRTLLGMSFRPCRQSVHTCATLTLVALSVLEEAIDIGASHRDRLDSGHGQRS